EGPAVPEAVYVAPLRACVDLLRALRICRAFELEDGTAATARIHVGLQEVRGIGARVHRDAPYAEPMHCDAADTQRLVEEVAPTPVPERGLGALDDRPAPVVFLEVEALRRGRGRARGLL